MCRCTHSLRSLTYPKFAERYKCILPDPEAKFANDKACCAAVVKEMNLNKENVKEGVTMLLYRADEFKALELQYSVKVEKIRMNATLKELIAKDPSKMKDADREKYFEELSRAVNMANEFNLQSDVANKARKLLDDYIESRMDDHTRELLETAKREGFDVLILDTAGRLAIDEELMTEVKQISDLATPKETLLVADAMTGQDAVNVAKAFNERLAVTGIVLTRVDGDARGGAALSMRAVTGRPVKLIGVGEKFDALEPFHPDRMATRILGMGDIVSLVERAAETIEKEDAEKLAAKVRKGQFDMDDLLSQLRQLRKMGGLSGLMGMLPGALQAKAAMSKAKIDEGQLKRQEAIILSMTPKERRNPDLIHASRKKRIAKGSGAQVQDVNKLLKQHADMLKMMKRVNKLGDKGLMRSLGGMGMPPGGMPPGFPR